MLPLPLFSRQYLSSLGAARPHVAPADYLTGNTFPVWEQLDPMLPLPII
jgi:hypothetical protein